MAKRNPQYDNLKFILQQFFSAYNEYKKGTAVEYFKAAQNENPKKAANEYLVNHLRGVYKEVSNFPHIKQLWSDLRKDGKTDMEAAMYIAKNFNYITDSRRNNFKNGEYVHIGRPKKEAKVARKKADRFNTFTEIRKSGTINVKELEKINYENIRNFTLKEAQRISYNLQNAIKRRLSSLKKKGFVNEPAQRTFENYGGFINIKTATANELKSFIRRGVGYLNAETSRVSGAVNVRKRVEGTLKTHGIDTSKFSEEGYKAFWGAARNAVDEGYGTLIGDEKYEILNSIESYLQGEHLENLDLEEVLNSWIADKAERRGIYLSDVDEIKNYIKDNYITEDMEEYE